MSGAGRPAVSLRQAVAQDAGFMYAVYASTRADDIAALGFDEAAAGAFLRMQFDAQDRAYTVAHPDTERSVIVVDGADAGRLYVERTSESIHVIDIALLAEYRGRGIGQRLLEDLLAEARATNRAVTLSAVRSGPALSLYKRLGFSDAGGDEVYARLEYRPADQANTAS